MRPLRSALALCFLVACAETAPLELLGSRPVANAGPDREARVGETVVLEGRGHDPEGDALRFRWQMMERPERSAVVLVAPNSQGPQFRVDRAGRYVFQLVVDDGTSMSAPDSVVVTATDKQVVVDAGHDQVVEVGEEVALRGTVSNSDGEELGLVWAMISGPDSPAIVDSRSLTPRFRATDVGIYVLELAVVDGSVTIRDAVEIHAVIDGNEMPVAEAGSNRMVLAGEHVRLDGSASRDPDGDRLSFTWTLREAPEGSRAFLEQSQTASPRFDTDLAGAYEIELVVNDGALDSIPDRVRVVARAHPPSDADVLDPAEVYIFGTVQEGLCGRSIITHWSRPNQGAVGFDCYTSERDAIIAPGRNRLLFSNTFEDVLREFHCDTFCVMTGNDGQQYPTRPMDNDPIIATPPCQPTSNNLISFRVWPDGEIIHSCAPTPREWFDAQGRALPGLTARQIVALGNDGAALVVDASRHEIVDTRTSSVAPVVGFPARASIITARARMPSGFWAVLADSNQPQLWSIEVTGNAQHIFTYAPSPMGYVPNQTGRLDGQQSLFQIGRGPATFEDVIVRRERDGPTTVIYTEADDPFVRLHISDIVTGP